MALCISGLAEVSLALGTLWVAMEPVLVKRAFGCFWVVALLALWPSLVLAEPLRLAAAGSLRQLLPELIEAYAKTNPEAQVISRFGASGQLAQQIARGAPDHLFLSANRAFADFVWQAGRGDAEPRAMAQGSLVLFRPGSSPLSQGTGLDGLEVDAVSRLAIAHPQHAPYGQAAKAALQEAGLWEALQGRIVIAENVAQAAQFAATGNVDLALIAYSQALALQDRGDWQPVGKGQELLIHTLIATKPLHPMARDFEAFLKTGQAHQILRAFGFEP